MITIDTDVLIEILDKKSEKGNQALKQILQSGQEICTTAISIHETLYGLHKYAKPIKEILLLPALNFTKKDATLSSKIEFETETKGKPVRRTDAMIAAIAINARAALYTFDLKHFAPLKTFGLNLFP
jgi:tRNA(fMet)-specific endonuclease VapC